MVSPQNVAVLRRWFPVVIAAFSGGQKKIHTVTERHPHHTRHRYKDYSFCIIICTGHHTGGPYLTEKIENDFGLYFP